MDNSNGYRLQSEIESYVAEIPEVFNSDLAELYDFCRKRFVLSRLFFLSEILKRSDNLLREPSLLWLPALTAKSFQRFGAEVIGAHPPQHLLDPLLLEHFPSCKQQSRKVVRGEIRFNV